MAQERTTSRSALSVIPAIAGRGPDDDFYCLRYRLWYASFDCAYRTRFRTSDGCLDCEQGRFNLARHAAEVARCGRAAPRGRG
jgi:hypothetical protein